MTHSIRLLRASAFAVFAGLLVAACATDPDATECRTGITCPQGTKCAAAQEVCITNDCGDGVVQSSEVCDDGNIQDGDGCASDCRSREQCGDNVLNAAAGELCDDGNTTGGDGCAADCRSVEICGNGIRDVNEACDDGNTLPGDGCSGNCKSTEICGNGIVDLNEKCDDGGLPGGCNDDCQGGTGCGDGHIDISGAGIPLEQCDDGNTDDHDDCRNNCHLNVCGDGNIQSSGARIEQCDPAVNFGETSGCNLDCTSNACGDGKINKTAGEECDLGTTSGTNNNADDKDCTSLCKKNVCGDMKINANGTKHEDCDDGNTNNKDGCSNICTTPHCGNGVIEMNEACDDANMTNGDGCSSPGCQFETCGDGVTNNGEDCDVGVGGVAKSDATCDIDCTFPSCGDGTVNQAFISKPPSGVEQCDDGNSTDTDACRNNCQIAKCGDGVTGPGEACDDGNSVENDGCNTFCQSSTSCGNGVLEGSEACDDGNNIATTPTADNDGCLSTCVYATCGDAKVYTGVEQCDEVGGNGVNKNCVPGCKTNVCGDGFQDTEGTGTSQTEACDLGAALNDLTSCPYGTPTCPICTNTCDTAATGTGSFCGDGVTDSGFGESCDDRSPTQSCGQCSNGCNTLTPAAFATAFIIASDNSGGNISDGDSFTLNDGFNAGVVFEFDKDTPAAITAGHVRVDVTGSLSEQQVRDKVSAAIGTARGLALLGGKGLRIDRSNLGTTGLLLTHDQKTSKGNQAITKSGLGANFFISAAMTGGAAGDCTSGQPCKDNEDCQSPTGAVVGNCQPNNTCL